SKLISTPPLRAASIWRETWARTRNRQRSLPSASSHRAALMGCSSSAIWLRSKGGISACDSALPPGSRRSSARTVSSTKWSKALLNGCATCTSSKPVATRRSCATSWNGKRPLASPGASPILFFCAATCAGSSRRSRLRSSASRKNARIRSEEITDEDGTPAAGNHGDKAAAPPRADRCRCGDYFSRLRAGCAGLPVSGLVAARFGGSHAQLHRRVQRSLERRRSPALRDHPARVERSHRHDRNTQAKYHCGHRLRARPHWGNGLMPEVIRALAAAALAHARLFRVRAFCGAENTASRRALEKAGF